jgi:hypothetical protein
MELVIESDGKITKQVVTYKLTGSCAIVRDCTAMKIFVVVF